MARPLRIEYPHAFYHVIQRGTEQKNIFVSDKDKEKFLSYLGSAHRKYAAAIHTYVLMNNHYHLILETPRANLSKIMHYLDASYAIYFNIKRKRTGPLYQGRYKAILVQEDEYLHHLSRYIHLNPVRAKIAKDPIEYRWSSYEYFVSTKKSPKWLNTRFILAMFHIQRVKAKILYRQFVLSGIGAEGKAIQDNTKNGIILGNESFFEAIKKKYISKKLTNSEIPAIEQITQGRELTLQYIKGVVHEKVPDNTRLQRKLSMYLSRRYTQMKLREIADFFGNIKYPGVSYVCKRSIRGQVLTFDIFNIF